MSQEEIAKMYGMKNQREEDGCCSNKHRGRSVSLQPPQNANMKKVVTISEDENETKQTQETERVLKNIGHSAYGETDQAKVKPVGILKHKQYSNQVL